METTTTKMAYTKKEVEEMMGVTRKTVEKWQNEGLISFSQIGKIVLFSPEDIQEFLDRNHVQAYQYVKS